MLNYGIFCKGSLAYPSEEKTATGWLARIHYRRCKHAAVPLYRSYAFPWLRSGVSRGGLGVVARISRNSMVFWYNLCTDQLSSNF